MECSYVRAAMLAHIFISQKGKEYLRMFLFTMKGAGNIHVSYLRNNKKIISWTIQHVGEIIPVAGKCL